MPGSGQGDQQYLLAPHQIDTNIWLESLLDQQQANVVSEFFVKIPATSLAMSDFTFHSIALALTRRQKFSVLQYFIYRIHGKTFKLDQDRQLSTPVLNISHT